jgi:teichuronic acid exporter
MAQHNDDQPRQMTDSTLQPELNFNLKALHAFKWSFFERLVPQILQFVIQIILARLLLPSDFGTIGVIMIFIQISQIFVDGGFSSALVQKNSASNDDFKSVWIINLFAGVFFYTLIFSLAPYIADYYQDLNLVRIIRILGLVLIINALSSVQYAYISKNFLFKKLTLISIISVIISGTIAIMLALLNYGVYSLVYLTLFNQLICFILIILFLNFLPKGKFSYNSIKQLFNYGSKLFLSSLLDTFIQQAYNAIIAKTTNLSQLGFYTRAKYFNDLPQSLFTAVALRVMFPLYSSIQANDEKIVTTHRYITGLISITFFPLVVAILFLAKSIILIILSEKWKDTITLYQIISASLVWYILDATNLVIIRAKGFSGMFLRIEIIKKITGTLLIIASIPFGMYLLVCTITINTIIAYLIGAFCLARVVRYPLRQQFRDIIPGIVLSIFIAVVAFPVYLSVSSLSQYLQFLIILGSMIAVFLGLGITGRFNAFNNLLHVTKLLSGGAPFLRK